MRFVFACGLFRFSWPSWPSAWLFPRAKARSPSSDSRAAPAARASWSGAWRRRAARLAQLGWGKTRPLIEQTIRDLEDRAFAEVPLIEKNAMGLFARDPEKARAFLTAYWRDFATAATQRYWDLGDELWDAFALEFF